MRRMRFSRGWFRLLSLILLGLFDIFLRLRNWSGFGVIVFNFFLIHFIYSKNFPDILKD